MEVAGGRRRRCVGCRIWLLRSRLSSRGFDWRVFRATLSGLQWGWLGAAASLVMAGYFGRALRWRVLMRPVKSHPNLWNLFSATVIGFAASTLLGRPGEFVRPYLIAGPRTCARFFPDGRLAARAHLRPADRPGHFRLCPRLGAPLGCRARSGAFLGFCHRRLAGGALSVPDVGAAGRFPPFFERHARAAFGRR